MFKYIDLGVGQEFQWRHGPDDPWETIGRLVMQGQKPEIQIESGVSYYAPYDAKPIRPPLPRTGSTIEDSMRKGEYRDIPLTHRQSLALWRFVWIMDKLESTINIDNTTTLSRDELGDLAARLYVASHPVD